MNHKSITIGMVVASFCSAAGLIAFCFVGLAATELMLIPQEWRLRIVVAGAAAVAVGAEGGSLFALVAAFEREGRLKGWDVVGAIVSQTATVLTIVFAFRALSGGGSSVWGYVANTVAVSMDATFNYVALGLHLRNGKALAIAEKQAALDYHRQAAEIERQRAEIRNAAAGNDLAMLRRQNAELTTALQVANAELDARDSDATMTRQPAATTRQGSDKPATTTAIDATGQRQTNDTPPTVAANSDTPTTTRQQWATIAASLGDTAPTTARAVVTWLASNGYHAPSVRTVERWGLRKASPKM